MSQKVTLTDDLLSKLIRVLKLILEKGSNSKMKTPDSLSIYPRTPIMGAIQTIGQDCIKLLNECLASHRYNEAVDLLWIISQDKSINLFFLFKATLIVLNNIQMDEEEKVEKMLNAFRSCMRLTHYLNKREVMLEYIVQSIIHQWEDRKVQLENMCPPRWRRLKQLEKQYEEYQLIVHIFEGYCIYLKCQELCESNSNEDDVSLDQAILKIHSLIAKPGNWDIFVLKLVEALEKFHREEEVRTLLSNYAEKQPHNLNAHIYLCSYLEKNDPSSELLAKHLKEIAKLSPSDERVLLLLKKWKKRDLTIFEALNLSFMFLDYPTNGKNISAWKILQKLLKHANKSNDRSCQKSVKALWKSRQKSWLWLHFNPLEITESNTNDTIVSIKTEVLGFLDKNHKYIKTVHEKTLKSVN